MSSTTCASGNSRKTLRPTVVDLKRRQLAWLFSGQKCFQKHILVNYFHIKESLQTCCLGPVIIWEADSPQVKAFVQLDAARGVCTVVGGCGLYALFVGQYSWKINASAPIKHPMMESVATPLHPNMPLWWLTMNVSQYQRQNEKHKTQIYFNLKMQQKQHSNTKIKQHKISYTKWCSKSKKDKYRIK